MRPKNEDDEPNPLAYLASVVIEDKYVYAGLVDSNGEPSPKPRRPIGFVTFERKHAEE